MPYTWHYMFTPIANKVIKIKEDDNKITNLQEPTYLNRNIYTEIINLRVKTYRLVEEKDEEERSSRLL